MKHITKCIALAVALVTTAVSASAATTWDHKVYKFVNVNSGKALDVAAYSLDLGGDVQQWSYNGTTNQMWTLREVDLPNSSVYKAIENINSSYVLDIRDWSVGNNYNNQAIQQWWKYGYYTYGHQQWQLYHLGSDRYNIISYSSGKYLSVDGSSTSDGAVIVQHSSTGGNEQKWDRTEVSHAWSTPSYNPSFWNTDSGIRTGNNCYNYANNRRTDTFSQPGKSSGQMWTTISVSELEARCNQDQLNITTSSASAPNGQTKIVMYIGYIPNGLGGYVWDYHLWRKDSNGMWTHKPGQTSATNLHAGGGTISDPAALSNSQRGGYDTLVGYFFTPSDSREGRGHGNVW